MSHSPLTEVLGRVRKIYEELSRRPREHACVARARCCHFQLTGQIPYLTKGEALLAARAWRATGRKKLPRPENGRCPMLEEASGRCLIYQDRPFGCRTHFCAAAGGPYGRREISDLIHQLEQIDVALGGTGGRKLPGAVTDAISELGN